MTALTFQSHLYYYPDATTKFAMVEVMTHGSIVGRRISGFRMPRFFRVAFMEIQSERRPLVADPIKLPIKIAKLK